MSTSKPTPNPTLMALPQRDLAIRTEAAEKRLGILVARMAEVHARAWTPDGAAGRCSLCAGRCALSGDWVPEPIRRGPEGRLVREAAPT